MARRLRWLERTYTEATENSTGQVVVLLHPYRLPQKNCKNNLFTLRAKISIKKIIYKRG